MVPEVGMTDPVLAVRSQSGGVGQRGLQSVELPTIEVRVVVDHDPGQALVLSCRSDGGFGLIDAEALLGGDPGDQPDQAGAPGRTATTGGGQGEVVGIAAVAQTGPVGQRSQPAIQAVGGQVGQRRSRRAALREVRAGQVPLQPVDGAPLLGRGSRPESPDPVGDGVGDQ
jgi:hypothetical protein